MIRLPIYGMITSRHCFTCFGTENSHRSKLREKPFSASLACKILYVTRSIHLKP